MRSPVFSMGVFIPQSAGIVAYVVCYMKTTMENRSEGHYSCAD
jgi:hypothetical protein